MTGTGATNAKSQIPNDRYSSPQRRKERKVLIIFRKSALLFFAVLPVRRYFGRINGKEEKKHLCVLRVSAVKKIGYFRFINSSAAGIDRFCTHQACPRGNGRTL
jgi:hypothetical protein